MIDVNVFSCLRKLSHIIDGFSYFCLRGGELSVGCFHLFWLGPGGKAQKDEGKFFTKIVFTRPARRFRPSY